MKLKTLFLVFLSLAISGFAWAKGNFWNNESVRPGFFEGMRFRGLGAVVPGNACVGNQCCLDKNAAVPASVSAFNWGAGGLYCCQPPASLKPPLPADDLLHRPVADDTQRLACLRQNRFAIERMVGVLLPVYLSMSPVCHTSGVLPPGLGVEGGSNTSDPNWEINSEESHLKSLAETFDSTQSLIGTQMATFKTSYEAQNCPDQGGSPPGGPTPLPGGGSEPSGSTCPACSSCPGCPACGGCPTCPFCPSGP